MKISYIGVMLAGFAAVMFVGCGDGEDDDANNVGIGAMCEERSDCAMVMIDEDDDEEVQLSCLTQFGGGYCAIKDCENAADCPSGSTCVAHDDGENYCFLECSDKSECNANRDEDNEANCSASFNFADEDDDDGQKACIPPSSGGGGGGAGGDDGNGKPGKN